MVGKAQATHASLPEEQVTTRTFLPAIPVSADLTQRIMHYLRAFNGSFRVSKNPGVDKGPQPLMFNPALTACTSERMKTQRFSYFAGFAARERMREAKPEKAQKSGDQPLF